jgi:GR25 family glycosyltransferase involved in LPS biosynthesis
MKIESFIINLDKFKEKYDKTLKTLSQIGLSPKRFSAIYGKDVKDIRSITYPSIDYTLKNGRFVDSDIAKHGAIGCYLSHTQLWKQLLTDDNDAYLIMEDDVFPSISNKDKLYNFIKHVDNTNPYWDLIFLGWMKPLPLKDKDIFIDNSLYQINDITFGLHAYLINKKGAKLLLEKSFPIVDQLDSYISYMASRGDIKAFRPSLTFFVQQNNESSIQENMSSNIKPFINRFSPNTIRNVIIITMIIILTILLVLWMQLKFNIKVKS